MRPARGPSTLRSARSGRRSISGEARRVARRCQPASSAPIITVSGMECRINGVAVHFVEHGTGVPLLALHGAGVDHREIEAAVEAIVPGTGYRRIYPDLPGMGRSTADGLTGNDDVVKLLGDLIDHLAEGPALLLGHSYGAYLARGVAAQRPDAVLGLALLCPVAERSRNVPGHHVVRHDADAHDELEPAHRGGLMSTSSCARLRPLGATAIMWCRARRSSTRRLWGASSPRSSSTGSIGRAHPTTELGHRHRSAVRPAKGCR